MEKVKFPIVRENEDLKKEFSYLPELEYNTNRPLILELHGPFDLSSENGKAYVIAKWLKSWIRNQDVDVLKAAYEQGRELKFYNPFDRFDQETFLKTIMSIDVNNADSVLDFYDNHGTLGFAGMELPKNSELPKQHGINLDTAVEEYSFFKKEISLLQNWIKHHEAVTNNDHEYFRTLGNPSEDLLPKDASTETVIGYAKKALAMFLNTKLDLIQPVVRISANGEFYKATTTSSLLGVFYFRFYEIVTENQKMRRCRYCGDYFIPRKSNANFCPPPEANDRSKCANRYDAMVRRIAEWHFKEGLEVEVIQQKLNKPKSRSIKEIQYIIDNYTGKLRN